MKLGISTYTYPWAFGIPGQPQPVRLMTHADLIDAARRLGASVVQIADNAPLSFDGSIVSVEADAGIEIELGTRGTDPRILAGSIAACERVGARVLRSVPDVVLPPRHDDAGLADAIAADLAAVIPALEAAGVTLCVENYEGCPVAVLARVIDAVGSRFVRVCLDSLNSLGRGEGYEAAVSLLGPLTGNLHVKDYAIRRADHRLGFLVEGRPAGDGDLPLDDLLARVPESVSAIVELWTPWQGDIDATIALEAEWAEQSAAELRDAIARRGTR